MTTAKEYSVDVKNPIALAVGAHNPKVLSIVMSNDGGAGVGHLQSSGLRQPEAEGESALALRVIISVAHSG